MWTILATLHVPKIRILIKSIRNRRAKTWSSDAHFGRQCSGLTESAAFGRGKAHLHLTGYNATRGRVSIGLRAERPGLVRTKQPI
jgi:hypothetical protein